MNLTKALAMALAIGAVPMVGTVLICGCGSTEVVETDSEPQVVQASEPAEVFSFEDEAVALPSPASVQLDPEGRLGERFQGNINYVRYQHDYYGE